MPRRAITAGTAISSAIAFLRSRRRRCGDRSYRDPSARVRHPSITGAELLTQNHGSSSAPPYRAVGAVSFVDVALLVSQTRPGASGRSSSAGRRYGRSQPRRRWLSRLRASALRSNHLPSNRFPAAPEPCAKSRWPPPRSRRRATLTAPGVGCARVKPQYQRGGAPPRRQAVTRRVDVPSPGEPPEDPCFNTASTGPKSGEVWRIYSPYEGVSACCPSCQQGALTWDDRPWSSQRVLPCRTRRDNAVTTSAGREQAKSPTKPFAVRSVVRSNALPATSGL